MRPSSVLLIASLSLALAACGKKEAADENAGAPTAPSPTTGAAPSGGGGDATARATEIFNSRCTPCHGATGGGDGAASASMNPRPRNFHDTAWQQVVTDDHLTKIIQFGGAAVGKSPAMPANPDLKDPAVVAALVAHVRELGKQP